MDLPLLDTMAFSSFFRKATNFLGLSSPSSNKPPPLDGEIIFCKNNVCVHPPAALSTDIVHHPGYLNIRSQEDEVLGNTLILTWIPNSTLQKNPRSIENSPNHGQISPRISPRRSPRQEYALEESQSADSSPTESNPPPIESKYIKRNEDGVSSPLSSTNDTSSPGVYEECGIPIHTKKRLSKDETSTCSSDVSSNYDMTSDKYNNSFKSQADSGIGPEDVSDIYKSSIIPTYSKPKSSGISQKMDYQHSNGRSQNEFVSENDPLIAKTKERPNPECEQDDSESSSCESPPTEEQLTALLQNKVNEKFRERSTSERTGSNRSVSIEMEGDNLMVVTEEIEDSPFDEQREDKVLGHAEASGSQTGGSSGMSTDADSMSLSSDSTFPSPGSERYNKMLQELQKNIQNLATEANDPDLTKSQPSTSGCAPNAASEKINGSNSVEKLKQSLDLKLNSVNGSYPINVTTPDISVTDVTDSLSSTPTSGPDSHPPTPYSSDSASSSPVHHQFLDTPGSPDFNMTHNMTFPENAVKVGRNAGETPTKSAKEQVCGVFSVDLGQMRSLRLFYNNDSCTRGQLVIASRESQYKILYFHHGGLDKLAECLSDWNFLAQGKSKRRKDDPMRCKQFSVIRPYLPDDQAHPEEGAYEMVNDTTWKQHMNDQGQIEDDLTLRKAVFFAGIDPGLRHEMWPFLLHYYPYKSTYEEREQIRNDKYIEYQNIRKQRDLMSTEEQERFWRSIQCTVEKDVVRTDRSHPYFKGEGNPHIEVLQNILLNYAVANPQLGYSQEMSDLLSPVLAEVQREADAYWCFVGLMQRTIFVSSPKDIDMDRQLMYLGELIRIMLPRFYKHLMKMQDGMALLFCHRWILLCFKREFPAPEALRIWEACWAHYQTDYFHLFVVLAIISVYGEDVVQQDLPADEMLFHFSSLSMHMNGEVVLRKARGMLHQFRTRDKIPCTLRDLCSLCGAGMWDSGYAPTVECDGNHGDDQCPYGGKPKSPARKTII